MKRFQTVLAVVVTLAITLGLCALFEVFVFNRTAEVDPDSFAGQVDLEPLQDIAVHTPGRLKAMDSFTSTVMQQITGPHRIEGQSPTFTYLDMMFRPAAYQNLAVVYVRKKPVRERLARAVIEMTAEEQRSERLIWADQFIESGLIAPQMLQHPAIAEELFRMRSDLLKTAKFVEEIDAAEAMMDFRNLLAGLRVIPPVEGDEATPWMTLNAFSQTTPPDVGIDAATHAALRSAWTDFAQAWVLQDADRASDAAARLASLLPAVNPALYPEQERTGWPWKIGGNASFVGWIASAGVIIAFLAMAAIGFRMGNRRLLGAGVLLSLLVMVMHAGALILGQFNPLELESFYFRNYFRVNEVWVLYLFSAVFLIMSIVYRWDWAKISGLTIFLVAFGFHTAALMLRWYVADRWPNSNMFEAVTTAAWFGGVGALVLETFVRRTAMRDLFTLGSAVASMTAFMAAHFLPQALDANITNKMPVLNDVWLYIHTNVIIFSYVLIFMASIVAGVYLIYRWLESLRGRGGPIHHVSVGGLGALVAQQDGGAPALATRKTTFGGVLDGATMVLVEVSFVLLWAGLVMGAIWADESWGRPWGWDPKEVFALNTFIIFVVLIHTRYKSRDKGLWTSILTIIGCLVMLFNWIFINFKISGLHSYA